MSAHVCVYEGGGGGADGRAALQIVDVKSVSREIVLFALIHKATVWQPLRLSKKRREDAAHKDRLML